MNFSHSLKVGAQLILSMRFCLEQLLFCSGTHILLNLAEIWLDWLKDEIRLTDEEPNREKVYELFERAVKDYICECIYGRPCLRLDMWSAHHPNMLLYSSNTGPDIWLEYTQYSIGGMGSPGGIDRVRSTFERAVTAVGLHMTKGQIVWEAFREFENAILSTLQVGSFFFFLFSLKDI